MIDSTHLACSLPGACLTPSSVTGSISTSPNGMEKEDEDVDFSLTELGPWSAGPFEFSDRRDEADGRLKESELQLAADDFADDGALNSGVATGESIL